MTDDLILSTRINALIQSLEQVSGLVTSMHDKTKAMDELSTLVSARRDGRLWKTVGEAQQKIQGVIRGLDEEVSPDELRRLLRAALVDLDQANDHLRDAKRQIDTMISRYVHPEESNREIENLARRFRPMLQDIRNDVDRAAGFAEQGRTKEAETLLSDAWRRFEGNVCREAAPVFAEYVDLLGGVALRETGFGEELCQYADEMIRRLVHQQPGVPAGGSLTIPARQEMPDISFARIIRLGFPDWNLWFLPLKAFELGRSVARLNRDTMISDAVSAGLREAEELTVSKPTAGEDSVIAKERERQQTQLTELLKDFFADAYATYIMGPAYAAAALLVRFDVLSADLDSEHPAPARRAHLILSALRTIDAMGDPMDPPYTAVHQQLQRAWHDALSQNNVRPLDPPDARALEQFALIMVKFCRDQGLTPPFYATKHQWADALLVNGGASISVKGDEEEREILNAAWLCRLKHPADVPEITTAALKLWSRVRKARPKVSSQGGGLNPPFTRASGH